MCGSVGSEIVARNPDSTAAKNVMVYTAKLASYMPGNALALSSLKY
jgi:hypothetical protein